MDSSVVQLVSGVAHNEMLRQLVGRLNDFDYHLVIQPCDFTIQTFSELSRQLLFRLPHNI